MFPVVKSQARTAAALVALAMPASALASRPPGAKQIRAAVQAAQHSRLLWATVNICNTAHHRHTIGIRGQAPSLPFATSMSMRIQVDYWNGKRFVSDPYATASLDLGHRTNEVVQNGANFTFRPSVVLSGTIEFEWKLAGRVIGRATRLTGHGYKHVAGGDPAGYSAATCRIS
jgi:hypothetical protein